MVACFKGHVNGNINVESGVFANYARMVGNIYK